MLSFRIQYDTGKVLEVTGTGKHCLVSNDIKVSVTALSQQHFFWPWYFVPVEPMGSHHWLFEAKQLLDLGGFSEEQ